MTARLLDVPHEVLALIIQFLVCPADRNALTTSCKLLYGVGIPFLYETFRYKPPCLASKEGHPNEREIKVGTDNVSTHLLRHVRHVEFISPSGTDKDVDCMHALEKDAIYRFEAMEGLDVSLAILAGNADHVGNRLDLHPFTRLKSQVLKVLLAIPEGRLESFRWFLKCCVPKAVLGKGGHLSSRQRNLKGISVDMGPSCPFLDADVWESYGRLAKMLDLRPFNRLTSIIWKGRQEPYQWSALRRALTTNHEHLCNLTLDFATFSPSALSRKVRHLIRKGLELPHLQSLLLRNIDLGDAVSGYLPNAPLSDVSHSESDDNATDNRHGIIAPSLLSNNPRLESLKLIECAAIHALFRCLTMEQHLNLKRLEIADFEWGEFGETTRSNLAAVLGRCDKLQSLYLLLQYAINPYTLGTTDEQDSSHQTQALWESLDRSPSRLQHLVYHERVIDNSMGFGTADWVDYLDRGLIRRVLSNSQLEFLGICDLPELMRPYLSIFQHRTSLKVIHIRSTFVAPFNNPLCGRLQKESDQSQSKPPIGPQQHLIELVKWVFGDSGIPSVDLIAYGDFSDRVRYRRVNLLFKRDPERPSSYLKVTADHPDWAGLQNPWRDSLSASPFSLATHDAVVSQRP